MVLGIEPRGILPLSYTPIPIFIFILKQGLTKLWRASKVAEAGRKPGSSGLSLKYWDYSVRHHARLIFYFFIFFMVLGIEPRGILPPSYTPSPIFIFILKQGLARLMRVSPFAEAILKPALLLSHPPKYWDYRCASPCPAYFLL